MLVWLAMVAACVILSHKFQTNLELCLFRKITTIPCPTCGATRGIIHFISGQPITGFMFNPLFFSFLFVVTVLTIVRVIFARTFVLSLSPKQRLAAWIGFFILLGANWAYEIFWVR